MTEILDTNLVLRYLVGDVEGQRSEAEKIFREAEKGKRRILVKPLVIAEACFVLESVYKKNREEIASSMEVFLAQKWLRVEDRQVMLLLWKWYRKNMHFVDSYLLASATIEKTGILTFDEKLKKKLKD